MRSLKIPVANPDVGKEEEELVLEAVRSGWISSMSPYVKRFEEEFARWLGVKRAIAVSNGTVALRAGELKKHMHIALPDCYVIATAEAVEATPLFKKVEAEIEPILKNLRRLKVRFLDEVKI